MIQPDKRPVQSDFANISDYSQKCPDGARKFFALFTSPMTLLVSGQTSSLAIVHSPQCL